MNKFQTRIVLDAIDQPESLSDWENEFIDSLAQKEENYVASTKQNETLNKIRHKLDYGAY